MKRKIETLREILESHAPLMIAYSGGVDSACLLVEAHRVLGPSAMTGVIADSASLPRRALTDALELAGSRGIPVEVIHTEELDNPDYAENPPNRCYFCKAELFRNMEALALERGFCGLAYGENLDDAAQVRPGAKAAGEFRVLAPLREAGLTKREIREHSRELGLPTADAPAQPCLSSRIPWGTPVSREALAMVERAEAAIRAMGFREFRVRHVVNGNGALDSRMQTAKCAAKLQFAPDEQVRAESEFRAIESAMLQAGYEYAAIDPQGYRPPATS